MHREQRVFQSSLSESESWYSAGSQFQSQYSVNLSNPVNAAWERECVWVCVWVCVQIGLLYKEAYRTGST